MPRHHPSARHNRASGRWSELEPQSSPLFTQDQIRRKRLELAEEMLGLVLDEESLAARPRQTLQRIYASLGNVRRQL